MKTFKEFLNEFANKTGEKELEFIIAGMLPLSPSILKDFEKDVKGVYHVTSIEGFKKLLKLEGRRIDISTFSRGSDLISKGLLEEAEILVTLDGKSSIQFDADVHSGVDRNGVRWLRSNGSGIEKLKNIIFSITLDLQDQLVRWFDIPKKNEEGRRLPTHIAISNWIFDKPGNVKKEFIKIFMLRAKKALLASGAARIKQIIDAVPLEEPDKGFSINHNEILLHNFKIKDSKIILQGNKSDENLMKRAKKAGMGKFKTINAREIRNFK